MDGKNSSGRRVSLLNDGPEAPTLIRLPSITPSLRSRTSSYTSSPIGSPPTPRLVRSDSSDSINMQTPSPITPDFGVDGFGHSMHSPTYSQQQYFDMQQNGFNGMPQNPIESKTYGAYPPPPQIMGQPGYPVQAPPPAFFGRPQMSTVEQQQLAPSSQAQVNVRPKKNSYPCPMAKTYGCNDYFTTSGHAARHAKKHTGKKDAFCPECNKAFTRKDNMEQHRRTHQSGRSTKGSDNGVKKAKPAAKRPRPSPLHSAAPTMSMPPFDPSLSSMSVSPDAANFNLAPVMQPNESFSDFSPTQQQRPAYPDPTHFSMSNAYSSSSGLDALAVAACGAGEKRPYES